MKFLFFIFIFWPYFNSQMKMKCCVQNQKVFLAATFWLLEVLKIATEIIICKIQKPYLVENRSWSGQKHSRKKPVSISQKSR